MSKLILPLFKTEYSLHRSILTLENKISKEKEKYHANRSIIELVKKNNIKLPFIVDDSISSYAEADKYFAAINQKFAYGIRITFCADVNDKSEESLQTECKYVILTKNFQGYKDLIPIWNCAAVHNFYYTPRLDFQTLKPMWTNNLLLAVPFYDSFLFNNNMTCKNCLPSTEILPEVYFLEENELPFDNSIRKIVKNYAKNTEIIEAQSIYYENKDNFLAYLAMRCIGKRSIWNKPQLDHLSSDTFNLENWKQKSGI